MARTAFIGAGSTAFSRNLSGDLLAIPELTGSGTRPVSRGRT